MFPHNLPFRLLQVWAHKTILTLPLFIEVPVPCQETERPYVSVLGDIDFTSDSMLCRIDFGTVPTVHVIYSIFYFIFRV